MASIARLGDYFRSRPVLANGLSTGFLFGAGDALAQTLFPEKKGQPYDYKRTLRNVVYGGVLFSPIVTKWYAFLAKKVRYPGKTFMGATPSPGQREVLDTGARTAADQLIWAPVGIPMYYVCMGLMEGKSAQEIKDRVKEKWWPTLVNNWKVWPLFQACNFYFVPVQYRVLTVNLVSILWNCYMSYTNYSPTPAKGEKV